VVGAVRRKALKAARSGRGASLGPSVARCVRKCCMARTAGEVPAGPILARSLSRGGSLG